MDCRDFEDRFEPWLADELPPGDRAACERHLAGCAACRELLDLAGAASVSDLRAAPEADLLGRVLEETIGSACRRAGELLASRLDEGPSDPLERELLELHLAACEECRALALVLAGLADDLPGLAEVRPDPAFVDDVLRATLPVPVRWRRALAGPWSRRWAAWARRPRFAWEAAFVLTLALLPVFASTAAPLAIPEAARELARENPVPRLGVAIDRRVEGTVLALERSQPVDRAGRTVAAARSRLDGARAYLAGLGAAAGESLGTFRDGAASLLQMVAGRDDDPTRPAPSDPTTTRADDGSKDETR